MSALGSVRLRFHVTDRNGRQGMAHPH